jgi:hypothetical protein
MSYDMPTPPTTLPLSSRMGAVTLTISLPGGYTFCRCGTEARLVGQGRLDVFAVGKVAELAGLPLRIGNELFSGGVKEVNCVDFRRCFGHGSKKYFRAFFVFAREQEFTQSRRFGDPVDEHAELGSKIAQRFAYRVRGEVHFVSACLKVRLIPHARYDNNQSRLHRRTTMLMTSNMAVLILRENITTSFT